MMLWNDVGPASQGKILTAILQGREDDARAMLHGWTTDDLGKLAWALNRTLHLANTERVNRMRRPGSGQI